MLDCSVYRGKGSAFFDKVQKKSYFCTRYEDIICWRRKQYAQLPRSGIEAHGT
jgi:hypothetical protein